MATIKYQEGAQGNKKIIVKTDPETDQQKVSCGCCDGCGLEVRSVTASLSHVGYLPFTCEGSEPPPTDTRYLKYRASGDGYIEACGVAPQHQNVTQEWEVDPFTGLTCYNDPESDIVSSGCSELQNCSATQKSYSCAFEGDPNDPCAPMEGGSVNWTESLQDSYTIEDVASNVDTVLGRINPYGNDGMPAGTRGSVVNGTNGSILTWVNECALNRAEYISGAGGVTKTKLFVKFTKNTQYTLTQSNGSVQTLTATEGQQIIVETPSEPNAWTDIAIINKTKAGCCNSSIVATTHTGQTTDSIFVPDEDAPPPPIPFIGPDCKKYLTERTVTTVDCTNSLTYNQKYGYGGGPPPDGDGCTYSRDESQKASILTITTSIENVGGDSINSTTSSGSSSYDETYKESCTGLTIGSVSIPPYNYTETTKASSIMSNGNSTTSSTITYNENGSEESVPSSYNGFLGGCSYDQLGEAQCPVISGQSITQSYILNILFLDTTELEQTTEYATQTTTVTTTYSNEFISQDQSQSGTWEDEDPEDNESLCASRTESETTKQSKNVAASVELTFTAPASESPITYEHWFHYYTVEVDSSEQGCPTSDVVAHNEKWTSVSSGGVLTLSRNINLSTPPKDHSICAQSLAFVTRVAS
jgi:hypothetical protein